jgi:hypothetical protein
MTVNTPIFATAVALVAFIALPAGAADSPTERTVDFSGPPPFKRTVVQKPDANAEFARFEEAKPVVGEQQRVVDFRGVPPYRRTVKTVSEADVVDFARFEEDTGAADRPRRSGPPGKTFSHRRR